MKKIEKGQYYSRIESSNPEYVYVNYLFVVAVLPEHSLVLADSNYRSWYGGQGSSNRSWYTFDEFRKDTDGAVLSSIPPETPPKPVDRQIEEAVSLLRKHGKIKKFFGVEHL